MPKNFDINSAPLSKLLDTIVIAWPLSYDLIKVKLSEIKWNHWVIIYYHSCDLQNQNIYTSVNHAYNIWLFSCRTIKSCTHDCNVLKGWLLVLPVTVSQASLTLNVCSNEISGNHCSSVQAIVAVSKKSFLHVQYKNNCNK